jgi:hypothetical protein
MFAENHSLAYTQTKRKVMRNVNVNNNFNGYNP